MAKQVAGRRLGTAPDAEPIAETADDARRDAGELHELVGEHVAYLRGAALRLSGDAEVAKDLLQETLARALQRFAQFKQGTNVRAWLTTILTRLYLDYLKHEKVVMKGGRELAALGVVTCDIDLTSSGVSVALWQAVETLEPDLREVVELRYSQQLSYKQIADKLELPVGTISTRLKRAHERLKELLKSR
jgi:RNA polymerase sigma-70 factor, ECF subfamily